MKTPNLGCRVKLGRLSTLSVGILFVAASASATILTFNIAGSGANVTLQTTHAAYGDSVNSLSQVSGPYTYNYLQGNNFTPNINLSYSVGPGTANQSYYYDTHWGVSGGPEGVDYLSSTTVPQQFFITFTPTAPGIGVDVRSFRLFRYNAPSTQNVDWFLHQGTSSGTVFDSGSLAVTGAYDSVNSIGTAVAPTINTAGLAYYGTVVLEFNHLTGDGGSLGLDDINFDQVVPEPSSLLLMGAGGALLWRRARKCRVACRC